MDWLRCLASDVLCAHTGRAGLVHWLVHFSPSPPPLSPALRILSTTETMMLTTQNKTVAYALGIYLLNLFLAFLQPKFDPSNEALDNEMEDGSVGSLPTKSDEEFRPFIRRLPEFKFWHSATTVIAIAFFCSWFEIFNVPVFWPVLVMYWFILFFLTSKLQMQYFIRQALLLICGKVRKQIQHMIKYRYVPFTIGKTRYTKSSE